MSTAAPLVSPARPVPSPFDRIDQLTRTPRPDATWWVALVETLDRLEERILEHRSNRRGLSRQLTFDAPHLAQRASSMDLELDGVRKRLRDLRGLAGRHAGEPGAPEVFLRRSPQHSWTLAGFFALGSRVAWRPWRGAHDSLFRAREE